VVCSVLATANTEQIICDQLLVNRQLSASRRPEDRTPATRAGFRLQGGGHVSALSEMGLAAQE
jgi:hypothetical protein